MCVCVCECMCIALADCFNPNYLAPKVGSQNMLLKVVWGLWYPGSNALVWNRYLTGKQCGRVKMEWPHVQLEQ